LIPAALSWIRRSGGELTNGAALPVETCIPAISGGRKPSSLLILSAEQKDTITNVTKAFRLENGESINFLAYVMRLEQKISLKDAEAEYALSVQ